MATHSSVLAWRIPGTGEPGGLSSVESHRVGHNGSNLAAAASIFKFKWTLKIQEKEDRPSSHWKNIKECMTIFIFTYMAMIQTGEGKPYHWAYFEYWLYHFCQHSFDWAQNHRTGKWEKLGKVGKAVKFHGKSWEREYLWSVSQSSIRAPVVKT